MPSLHSRFLKGKGKENLASMHKGERRRGMSRGIQDAYSLLNISAKIKHLWKSGCQMASNQECLQQNLSPKYVSVFLTLLLLFFLFLFHKQNELIWSKVLKSPNARARPNEENCNNVWSFRKLNTAIQNPL